MVHRQHAKNVILRLVRQNRIELYNVFRQITMREHRALGSTGRARRVNERGHIRIFPLRFRGNAFRRGDAPRFFDKRRNQKQRRRRAQFFMRYQ